MKRTTVRQSWLFTVSLGCALGCSGGQDDTLDAGADAVMVLPPICDGMYGRVENRGALQDDALLEASGIVASRQSPGVLWLHNDSGSGAVLYATGDDGRALGRISLADTQAEDLEDIALGPCPDASASCLWVADTGNNLRNRDEVTVYATAEPVIQFDQAFVDQSSGPVWRFPVQFPDGPVDIEAMVITPDGQALYFFEKNDLDRARIYRLQAPFVTDQPATLEDLGDFASPGFNVPLGRAITGADLHVSGTRLLMRVYTGLYEYRFDAGQGVVDLDAVEPQLVDVPLAEPQGEAVSYDAAGSGVWSVSEDVDLNPGQPLHHYSCAQ